MTVHLTILIWLPLAAALAGSLLGPRIAPRVALLGALGTLGYAVVLLADFERGSAGLQYLTDETWISSLGIHYKLGVDGLNVLLVALSAIAFFAAFAWVNVRMPERPRLFVFHLALAEAAVIGAFLAQDLALFVVFFDLMLVPFYFLTGAWGGGDRVAATTKLVIYTLVGSLLMLVGAVALAVLSKPDDGELSFVLSDLAKLELSGGTQQWIFLLFAAAFLVKMPAFLVHGWMPDGYRAMPLAALAVFSGVLSKVAAYGFLKIALPLLPEASAHFQDLLLVIGLASVLYGSAMAFTTTEVRLVLGYSSMAQLGFIVLGIFALQPQGAQGAVLQMVNHGIVVVPLFFLVAVLAERAGGSEDLRDMGGIAFRAPVLAAFLLILVLANLAMPGSANFMGEFMILLGLFKVKLVFTILAFVGVAAASVYSLRAFIRAVHNRKGPAVESRELRFADGLVVAPLVLVLIVLSLYPQFGLARSERSVKAAIAEAQVLSIDAEGAFYDKQGRPRMPGTEDWQPYAALAEAFAELPDVRALTDAGVLPLKEDE